MLMHIQPHSQACKLGEGESSPLPLFKIEKQASAYEVCDRMCTPLHTPKTLEMCKKKHALFG